MAATRNTRIQFYRKRVDLFNLLNKIKLWPSRTGVLHGIRTVERRGEQALITTHCGASFVVYNSRNSRAARWLRNKWHFKLCPKCGIPDWKLEKFQATRFSAYMGSDLTDHSEQ